MSFNSTKSVIDVRRTALLIILGNVLVIVLTIHVCCCVLVEVVFNIRIVSNTWWTWLVFAHKSYWTGTPSSSKHTYMCIQLQLNKPQSCKVWSRIWHLRRCKQCTVIYFIISRMLLISVTHLCKFPVRWLN